MEWRAEKIEVMDSLKKTLSFKLELKYEKICLFFQRNE